MRLPARSPRAALTALAVGIPMIAAPPATAATRSGPAMPAADTRLMQAQGRREVMVERQPGVTAAEQASLRAQAGVSYVGPGPLPNTEVDQAPVGGLSSAVASLRGDPEVQFAEPNGQVEAA